MLSSSGPSSRGASLRGQIAKPYLYFFLYIEPVSALVGAFFAFWQQQTYLDLTDAKSTSKDGISISTEIVLKQLSNLYLFFAMNEALVLRSTSDLKVWRTLLFCLLVADFGHLYSVSALGSEIYWRASIWNSIDWGNVGFVYAGAIMRLAFLARIGVAEQSRGGTIGQAQIHHGDRMKAS